MSPHSGVKSKMNYLSFRHLGKIVPVISYEVLWLTWNIWYEDIRGWIIWISKMVMRSFYNVIFLFHLDANTQNAYFLEDVRKTYSTSINDHEAIVCVCVCLFFFSFLWFRYGK